MELSKAGYYADLVLYPSLIVGLGVREMIFVHAFPFVWLCSIGSRIVDLDDRRVWSASLRFAFYQIGRPTS